MGKLILNFATCYKVYISVPDYLLGFMRFQHKPPIKPHLVVFHQTLRKSFTSNIIPPYEVVLSQILNRLLFIYRLIRK